MARLIVSGKRIADPLKSVAVDQHAVSEAAVALRLARQIVPRGEDDALALDRGDARCSLPAEIRRGRAAGPLRRRPASCRRDRSSRSHPCWENCARRCVDHSAGVTARRPFLGFAAAHRGGIVGLRTTMSVQMTEESAAFLHVVATPLGNLADLTRRARTSCCRGRGRGHPPQRTQRSAAWIGGADAAGPSGITNTKPPRIVHSTGTARRWR